MQWKMDSVPPSRVIFHDRIRVIFLLEFISRFFLHRVLLKKIVGSESLFLPFYRYFVFLNDSFLNGFQWTVASELSPIFDGTFFVVMP